MAELIAEAEFMGKRQTLEQQTQRLKIATEVAKSKAGVKLLENTREINGKVDKLQPLQYTLQKVIHQLRKKEFAKVTIQKEVVMLTKEK